MKPAKKQTMTAIDVPQSDDAANALLAEYGECVTALANIETGLNDAAAKVKATYEAMAMPHEERMMIIFLQLTSWGAAHRDRLTDLGKSKTVQLKAGAIGWRARPPSVRWAKGLKVEDIVAAIKKAGMRRFLRLKSEPNKERMLEEPESAKLIPGVIIGSAGEDFFVAPFGAGLAEQAP
jgi:phage host-nuclease inhibitor protein Gam